MNSYSRHCIVCSMNLASLDLCFYFVRPAASSTAVDWATSSEDTLMVGMKSLGFTSMPVVANPAAHDLIATAVCSPTARL